ncbi:MAG: hypothetical protein ABJE66_21430 [Deltaproteobacteria bacterium]
MRRSTVVKLTLLPMLATVAVAAADPGPPPQAPASAIDALPPDFATALSPPGMTEPMLSPPGLTPPRDCADDDDWESRPECTVRGGVIYGGFGHYFWIGGG